MVTAVGFELEPPKRLVLNRQIQTFISYIFVSSDIQISNITSLFADKIEALINIGKRLDLSPYALKMMVFCWWISKTNLSEFQS